ncbi:hypothetical protein NHX12_015685, partial [Muraenolepis orangiensis]
GALPLPPGPPGVPRALNSLPRMDAVGRGESEPSVALRKPYRDSPDVARFHEPGIAS